MKQSYAAALALLALAACADQQPTSSAARTAPVRSVAADGKYIVVLEEGANPRSVAAIAGINPTHVYTAALTGFAAELNAGQLNALQHNPSVDYVEADAPVKLFTTQTTVYSWGIDRIDSRDLPLSNTFVYTGEGAGTHVYILDSGINKAHLDFGARANYIPSAANGNFVGDARPDASDCHGHGTHVAGTAAGTYSGVAKSATIWAGRVVNCSGGGTTSMVIAGMDWVAANGLKPAAVNMSLGYGNVQSVRDAATRLVAAGFVVVAAAGNGNFGGTPIDACTEAPAGAPTVITVGSTTNTDAESSFSNYGTCVDILAPGSAIMSSDYTVTNGLVSKSGTSMASPHVAGVAAVYLGLNPLATPAQVTSAIKANGTPNTITLHTRSKKGFTPNLFLFHNY
ncbi:MAG TPA: S8 family peptidase [Longimicrobium sp.]|nr:S8 family peptidase [Longimicrobium sp.]